MSGYCFPLAQNVLVAELTYAGTLRPLHFIRNANGKLVLKKDFPSVQIGDEETAVFKVKVDQDKGNLAHLSHEFSDWGSDVYQATSTMFIGTVWPFGESELPTIGTTPQAGHIDNISYTFKRELRKYTDGSSAYVWVLGWTTAAGRTLASSTIDLVEDTVAGGGGGGGGGRCYVTLRLPEKCGGEIEFPGRFASYPFRVAPATLAAVAPSAALKVTQATSLAEAFKEIQNLQIKQWEIAVATRQQSDNNEDYLNPIRDAICEHAKALTLEALAKHST